VCGENENLVSWIEILGSSHEGLKRTGGGGEMVTERFYCPTTNLCCISYCGNMFQPNYVLI